MKHYLNLPEGQIHYVKSGKGEPIILFHQAPLSSVEWELIIPLLSQHFEVYAPDMVGHGQSYDPPREFFIEDFTATTLKFMDALGIESAYLVGNHSGAALATSIAINAPERVKKMMISCEMLASSEEIMKFVEVIKSKPLTRDIPLDADGKFLSEAWVRYKFLIADTSPLQNLYTPFMIGQAARFKPYDIHESVLTWMAQDDWMAKLPCPTLIFGADQDIFYDESRVLEAPVLYRNIDSHIIKDAGAFSTFEQPEAIAQMILNYLNKN